MKKSILLFPHKLLRTPALPVEKFDRGLEKLVRNLHRLMLKQKLGIGIAAPQLGISRQIAIVDVSPRFPESEVLYLINPRILELAEPFIRKEGCMSLPEYTGYVERYNRVTLEWYDMCGKPIKASFTGIQAVCIQHEVDHLHGKLFLDRIACLKTGLVPRM